MKRNALAFFVIISGLLHVGVYLLFYSATYLGSLPAPILITVMYRSSREPTASSAPPSHLKRRGIPNSSPQKSAENETQSDNERSISIEGARLGIDVAYPRLSRLLGENGKVLIEIRKDLSGFKSTVNRSSGFTRLDESAFKASQEAINSGLLAKYFGERESIQLSFIFKLEAKSK